VRSRAPITASELPRTPSLREAFAPKLRSILHTLAGIATVGSVVAALLAARAPLAATWPELAGGRRLPLALAAACAPLVPFLTAAAWRSVLASCGVPLDARRAWACYGAGSLANTILPARAGDALRIELFSRRLDHARRRWLACGVATSIGLAQSVVLGLVLGLGSIAGALPLWAAAPTLALPAVMLAGGRLASLRRPHGRVACLATPSRLSIGAWSRLLAWVSASALARLLVITSILDALAVAHPLTAAVVATGGLALGNSIPFAPGGAGVAAATMAVALGRTRLPASTAVAAAVAFHAFETGAGLAFGIGGWLQLKVGRSPPIRVGIPARAETFA
jgi:uncharacterized membrane protein YbhN (UPF0104 family)